MNNAEDTHIYAPNGNIGMAEYSTKEMRTVLLACCTSCFVAPLLSTMMNLSLVNIGEEFDVGSHDLAYVNTAFLLSSVIFMVPMSKLGDIVGKKRLFIASLVGMIATCILASLSPTFWFLIACRAAMAVCSAAVMSLGVSMIADVYPPQMRGGAIGIQTMCVYIGLSLGPTLGGILNDAIGWHHVFLVIVPIAALAALAMLMFPGEIRPAEGRRLDTVGSLYYGLAMLLIMGGVINLPALWAWPSMAVGAVMLYLFVRRQLTVEDKLLDVTLFKNRVFSGSCLAAFLVYASSYSISFFLALYLQSIGELSASAAGSLMLIQPAVQAVFTPLFGKLSDRMEDKRILPTAGVLLVTVGLVSMSTYGLEMNLTQIVATMLVGGFGFAMFSAPNVSIVMGSVPKESTGEASAVLGVTRQGGMMVSMGLAMMVIALTMGSADHLVPERYPEFIEVIRITFIMCAGFGVVSMVASMLRKPVRRHATRF